MRLELRQNEGPAGSARIHWVLERGRRTIGRSADCDWQVPDTNRTVSKLHCTILRDREGFTLRDESANGTRVDGVMVMEGETARLRDRSRIEFGGFIFSARVTGEPDRDIADPDGALPLGNDQITITSILADVAPGGQTARGILGGMDFDALPLRGPEQESGRKRKKGPSSRKVDIGWDGPPRPEENAAVLPDDWNLENETSNRIEHGQATRVSVPITRQAEPDLIADAVAPEAVTVPEDVEAQPVSAALLARIGGLIGQCEEALGEAFGAVDMADAVPAATLPPGAAPEAELAVRLEALRAGQSRLAEALQGLVREASNRFEPRLLEARSEAGGIRMPWGRDGRAWQAYRRQFRADGRDLTIRDMFRDTMQQALGMAPAPAGDAPATKDQTP